MIVCLLLFHVSFDPLYSVTNKGKTASYRAINCSLSIRLKRNERTASHGQESVNDKGKREGLPAQTLWFPEAFIYFFTYSVTNIKAEPFRAQTEYLGCIFNIWAKNIWARISGLRISGLEYLG